MAKAFAALKSSYRKWETQSAPKFR